MSSATGVARCNRCVTEKDLVRCSQLECGQYVCPRMYCRFIWRTNKAVFCLQCALKYKNHILAPEPRSKLESLFMCINKLAKKPEMQISKFVAPYICDDANCSKIRPCGIASVCSFVGCDRIICRVDSEIKETEVKYRVCSRMCDKCNRRMCLIHYNALSLTCNTCV